jgi:hypothetical protein
MPIQKPSKFHKKLDVLIGDWSGDEVMHPSAWDPAGGTSKGRYKTRAIAGGFGVVQDYEQRRGGKVTFSGHGVFGYDVQEKCYLWHWSDSLGGVPCNATKGHWTGNKLVWCNEGPMGQSRYTHTFLRNGKVRFTCETSPDGEQWTLVMEAEYTKKAKQG